MKDHKLMLLRKTHEVCNNNNNNNNNNNGLYTSLDIRDPFSSGPEMNLDKWTKELEN